MQRRAINLHFAEPFRDVDIFSFSSTYTYSAGFITTCSVLSIIVATVIFSIRFFVDYEYIKKKKKNVKRRLKKKKYELPIRHYRFGQNDVLSARNALVIMFRY